MGAIALFGVPTEKFWPYDITKFDNYRLDPPGATTASVLATIKTWIAAGFPSEFGFTVYSSISLDATTGKIPFPCAGEKVLGGHAIDVVGHDDNMKIKNTSCNLGTTGAFLIRNSWGTG